MEHGQRVEQLVLVEPAGLRGKERPTSDVLSPPPERIPSMLVTNFDVIKSYLPEGPDLDFMGERYREGGTLARLLWEHPYDLKLSRHLHRLTMPTLLVWGEDDRLIPVQLAELWRQFIPKADIQIFKGAGHLVLDEKREAVDAWLISAKPSTPKTETAEVSSERACPAMPRLSWRAAHRLFFAPSKTSPAAALVCSWRIPSACPRPSISPSSMAAPAGPAALSGGPATSSA
jgi:hypothetical protein